MRLVLERMKVFVEPSAVVGLAVVLYDETFRSWVRQRQQEEGVESWDMGIIFSGGNTTVEAIVGLFGSKEGEAEKRAEAKVGSDGKAVAENVAG
jgi:threonine dehydratase